MVNINLLPSAQRRPVVAFDRGLAIGLTLIVLEVLGIAVFTAVENVKINRLNTDIANWQQQVANENQQVREVFDLRDQADQLRAKAELLERIKQSPLQVAEILTDFANDTPPGVWFSSVQVNHSTNGGSVVLSGHSSALREVADLMLNLDGSPVFGDAFLNTSTKATGNAAQAGGNITFNVTGQLSPAVIGQ